MLKLPQCDFQSKTRKTKQMFNHFSHKHKFGRQHDLDNNMTLTATMQVLFNITYKLKNYEIDKPFKKRPPANFGHSNFNTKEFCRPPFKQISKKLTPFFNHYLKFNFFQQFWSVLIFQSSTQNFVLYCTSLGIVFQISCQITEYLISCHCQCCHENGLQSLQSRIKYLLDLNI